MGAAHDPQDRFRSALNVLHVPYDNPGRMVDTGNHVCQQARGGTDFDAIYPTVASNGYASAQAGQIMGLPSGRSVPTWRVRSIAGPTARRDYLSQRFANIREQGDILWLTIPTK